MDKSSPRLSRNHDGDIVLIDANGTLLQIVAKAMTPLWVALAGVPWEESKTLRERCNLALSCLPDALYREQLARLFDDLLSASSGCMRIAMAKLDALKRGEVEVDEETYLSGWYDAVWACVHELEKIASTIPDGVPDAGKTVDGGM